MSTDTVDEVAAEGSDVLRITDLNVRFATDSGTVNAVEDVSLEVGDREVVAIVGESGSGKSVTARSILGLLSDTASEHGAVVLRSHSGGETTDVVGLSSSRLRRIRGADAAMVFQEPSTTLNPVFTVGWQIAEGLRAHGKYSRAELRRRSVEMLKLVGIPDPERRVNDYPHQFSGGQKQRIVIAMALSLNPGLIIADEPTTALDVTVQAEILGLLRRCREEMGASIILITHNMGVVADLSDRVVVMYQGRIVESNEVHELFAHPQHEYTKALLAAVPRIGRHPVREVVDQDGDPVVTARDLRIEYPGRLGRPGFQAVRGIDLELRPGEVLGLVGESGSGKTTIGRAIAGLTPVSGGSLTVLGHEMLGIRERRFRSARRDLGFVFQDPASSFDPQLTIGDCIAEPLVVHGVFRDAAAARGRVEELLAEVQLPGEYANRYPHELSGGQRQRVSLAHAISLDPTLLIADEPTSALDVSVQAKVLDLFRTLQDRLHFACLFITHDLGVVDQVAHRVAVLHEGRVVEVGTTRRVLTSPEDAYTKRLVAAIPVPDPSEQAHRRMRAVAESS